MYLCIVLSGKPWQATVQVHATSVLEDWESGIPMIGIGQWMCKTVISRLLLTLVYVDLVLLMLESAR